MRREGREEGYEIIGGITSKYRHELANLAAIKVLSIAGIK
jgi:hypothetical protein